MGDLERIVGMLEDPAAEKRAAAAIVLGELRPRGAAVVDALCRVALEDGAAQVHALGALARIGARRVVEKLFPLLGARDETVRQAAAQAIASVGAEVVPLIRRRLDAASPEERRGLDAILAELGGKDALATLLERIAQSDAAGAQAAVLALRAHLRDAGKPERRTALKHTKKFIAEQKKAGNATALAAGLKILGYLADAAALPIVLGCLTDRSQPEAVRKEAVIALRFVLPDRGAERDRALDALIDCAADEDRALAETAMLSLMHVPLGEAQGTKLRKLVDHPDLGRARMVLEKLGQQRDADAAKLLCMTLLRAEKRRAELAAELLRDREEAAAPLARALLEALDPDRRWLMRSVLRPFAARISPALRQQILAAALGRLEAGERGWEAYLDVAQAADARAAAEGLRQLAGKLRKMHPERALTVLGVLARSEHATDEDRWEHAMVELSRSSLQLSASARAGDEALRRFEALSDAGVDVVGRLRKLKSVELEQVYYLGFHFAERRDPIGTELLELVVEKGGRTKLAKMAKSKLAVMGAG